MVYSRSYTLNECFCSSFSPLQYEIVLYRILIESFRFEEVEVVHARKPASFFWEKRDSRRHSTKGFSDNAVVAGSSYQMYHKVIIWISGKGLTSLSNHTNLSGEKK